jgi:hypothetical protein
MNVVEGALLTDGVDDGRDDTVGAIVGLTDGNNDGCDDAVGYADGESVGMIVGRSDGGNDDDGPGVVVG